MELVLFALVGLLACCLAGSVWRAIAKRDSTRGAWSSCRPAVEWLSELPALRRVVDPANLPFLPVVELLAQRIVPAATSAKFEWTGAVSMAWDNAGNWTRMEGTAGQYPGDEGADDVNDQAIFTGNRPNKCVLSSDRTVKNLYMNFNQALEVTNGATLTVKGLIEPGPMGKDFEFQMYGGTLRLKDNAKLNLQGKTVHLYKGGFIDSGGTGVGSIFVSDNSLFYMSIDGTYLGANLVVGKDAAGNESQGRVDLGLLNGNIKLFKNANITIHKQGTLTLEQARDSDTKGGIDRDVGTTSKIENYGKIIRTTKDLGNKYLKIVPPVEGLGDDSVLELGKGCLIDFVNEYKHNAGTFKKGDGSDIKGFNPRGGKTMLLDPGAPGRYFTYISGDVSFTDGSIQFVNTTPGAFVTLVVSGDLTLGPNVTVSINVDGSTAELSDTIEVDGLATIDAAHLSTITKTASPAPGQLYTFLTATDGLSGTGWAADPINSGYQAQSIFPALNQLQAVSPSSSLASSTGRAWFDANNDGIRDMSELPLANVMVYLYDDQDHLIAPALTDANGQYSFWGVPAGDYYLVFSNPVGQENWYTFSPQDVGNDDTKDSDVDSYGQTATFTLTTAQSMTGIDAGFVSLPPVAEDDTASTPINTPVTVAVLDNDSDPEGAELTVVSVNQPNHGSAVINPDNTITYTPSLGFLGTDTFSYTVQDPTGATSTAVVSVIVTKGETTTTLTSSANPSTSGQMVTLTATVLPAGGSGMVTGTVTFLDGTTVLGTAPVMGNIASFATSTLGVGSHNITAVYSGDASYNGSTSAVLTQTVNAPTTTTYLSSSANPSWSGQAVTFWASVMASGGADMPTGTVSFYDGQTLLGTAPLNGGMASFTTSALGSGDHAITAVYSGDATFLGSSSAVLMQTVTTPTTTTYLSGWPNPTVYGQQVTLSASVMPSGASGTPTGSVSFYEGQSLLGTVPLSGGLASLSLNNLAVGSHSITAVYSGDALFPGSTSAVLTLMVTQADTSTLLMSSQNPAPAGTAVTFTATVYGTGATPTGSVEFWEVDPLTGVNLTLLGTVTLDPYGVAVLSLSFQDAGTHRIKAIYLGSDVCNGSSATLDQSIT